MNSNFCFDPWYGLYIGPFGNIGRCCSDVSTFNKQFSSSKLGNISSDNISYVWNSDEIKKTRLDMLSGKEIHTCLECNLLEKNGLPTDRKNFDIKSVYGIELQDFQDKLNKQFIMDKTDKNGFYPDGPLFLAINFGNICNLECKMCRYYHLKFNTESETSKLISNKHKLEFNPDFLDDIKYQKNLKYIYITGDHTSGEPLFNEAHYILLDFLIKNGLSSNMTLYYNTNLTFLPGINTGKNILNKYGYGDIFEIWSSFKKVQLMVSGDGYGDTYNYIRKPANWKEFTKNVFLTKEKGFLQGITFLVQKDNVFNYLKMKLWAYKNGIYLDYQILEQPNCMFIGNLSQEEKQKLNSNYLSFSKKFRNIFGVTKDLFEILNIVNSNEINIESVKEYEEYTKKYDIDHMINNQ